MGTAGAQHGMRDLALKVRLNDKSVGLTKAIKHTEWSVYCVAYCLKSDELQFLNISSANKVAI